MKEKTKTDEILEKLDQGLTELFNSENYRKYLDVMAKFHNYSFNNTLLIATQNPEASLVAGYSDWQRKFQRQVIKGEKGINILAPSPYKKVIEREVVNPTTGLKEIEKDVINIMGFKPVVVFDISQTEGKELPAIGIDELMGNVKHYNQLVEVLKEISPVPVLYETINNGTKGYYSSTERKIVINDGMEQKQTLKTLIHEVAHALLHDRDGVLIEGVESGDELNRITKEVQAESVAYTVCQYMGIDTSEYSFGYIAGWSSDMDKKELKTSMETIRKTVNHMVTEIEKQLTQMDEIVEKLEKVVPQKNIPKKKIKVS